MCMMCENDFQSFVYINALTQTEPVVLHMSAMSDVDTESTHRVVCTLDAALLLMTNNYHVVM